MPRPLLFLIACSLFTTNLCGQEAEAPSPAVKRILDKAVGKVRTNRTEFDKANKKPLDEARAELQDVVTKLNKDGKIKEAKDILTQIETLEVDVLKLANAPAPAPVGGGGRRVLPQKPLLDRMEGKWDLTGNYQYAVITRNGDAQLLKDNDNTVVTGGRVVNTTPELVEIHWNHGWKWTARMAGEDIVAVVEWDPEGKQFGQGLALQRIK